MNRTERLVQFSRAGPSPLVVPDLHESSEDVGDSRHFRTLTKRSSLEERTHFKLLYPEGSSLPSHTNFKLFTSQTRIPLKLKATKCHSQTLYLCHTFINPPSQPSTKPHPSPLKPNPHPLALKPPIKQPPKLHIQLKELIARIAEIP